MAGFSPFQNSVEARLKAEGWAVIKDGLPDFLCIRGNTIRWVECKTRRDRLWSNQRETIELLREAGFQVDIIREGS